MRRELPRRRAAKFQAGCPVTSRASRRVCSRSLSTSFRSSAIFPSFESEPAGHWLALLFELSKRSLISGNAHPPPGNLRTTVVMLTTEAPPLPVSSCSAIKVHVHTIRCQRRANQFVAAVRITLLHELVKVRINPAQHRPPCEKGDKSKHTWTIARIMARPGKPLDERTVCAWSALDKRSATRVRTVAELFPEVVEPSLDSDGLPSCSAVEALR